MSYSPSRLRELLEAQGRRQDWLAAQTDYDPATVTRFLNGTNPISEKFALRAAKALQVPVAWLQEPQTAGVAA